MSTFPRTHALVLTSLFLASAFFLPHASAETTLGPNLITNASLEIAGSNGLPNSWFKGGYGTNTRTLTYPVTPAAAGSAAAKVEITSYTSGDAKWYFNYVPVTAGEMYQFSDSSFSNVSSEIDAQVRMSDGTFRYIVLAQLPASASYQTSTSQFTAPAGASAVTVFHIINRVGTLTVDNYSLNQITVTTDTNLIDNGDLELMGQNGTPTSWLKGGWGSNTRTFTYPTTGVNGSRAAAVSISQYSSGDAKWYFAPLALSPGIYVYSDSYKSNVPSTVVVQYHNNDGSYTYHDLAYPVSQNQFTTESVDFIVPRGVQDVTVFHLIHAVGTLTIDNVAVRPNTYTTGVFQNGAVTLTFDNGWLSHYQNAMPKMNQYGFKGTFYIITRELSDYGFNAFMSKAQIQDMYRQGMEIGSHTQTHPDLPTLTYDAQHHEIYDSRSDLFALNVGPVNSFAYPFGDFDDTSTALVKGAGYTNARATINGYAPPDADRFHLPRLIVLNTTTIGEMERWVDDAQAYKAWLIIEFHQVDQSGAQYAVTPAVFNQLIDYLAQKHASVVTMQQGVQDLLP